MFRLIYMWQNQRIERADMDYTHRDWTLVIMARKTAFPRIYWASTVGWPLKSCTHTGIFPSVSGHPTVKRRLRKVPIISDTSFKHSWFWRGRRSHVYIISGISFNHSWFWRGGRCSHISVISEMKWWCFRPLLCTLFRLNWAKQTPGIMRRN